MTFRSPFRWTARRFLPITWLCLALLSACQAGPQHADQTPWSALLTQIKLTPQTAQLEPNRWRDGGLFRLHTFESLWDDWRLLDGYAISSARQMLAAAPSFYRLGFAAAQQLDLTPAPVPKSPGHVQVRGKNAALIQAILDLHAALNDPLDAERRRLLISQAAAVPPEAAHAAAILLEAVPSALQARRRAFAGYGTEQDLAKVYDRVLKFGLDYDVDPDIRRLLETMDLAELVRGGLILADAMDRATAGLKPKAGEDFAFAWNTPIGKIALNGSANNVYDAAPYLLILDTGGDDVYRFHADARRTDNPISLIVDLAGNDRYESDAPGAFGAGILGYGFLLDVSGNDVYKTGDVGPGTGLFGVGMLIDRSGNDTYLTHRVGEGAAVCGIGILSDLSGKDTYRCMEMAQGYGGVRGCGVLVDRMGDDTYEADDTHIDYPSPQTAQHNVSLAQGCAFGRRAHPGDGYSLAGGVGLLVDGQGDDHYRCGVFGQGTAYWYGLGMLVDMRGNDSYEGVWYCQGSAAHYAVAALCDLGGDDHYLATMHQSQGQGHDFSIGLLYDARGNDVYTCQGDGSDGSGRWNGIGLFWDAGGDNTYHTGINSLGEVGDSRPESLCLGLFADTGTAHFPNGRRAHVKSSWVTPPAADHPLAHGLGMAK